LFIDGNAQQAMLLRQPPPVYPPQARKQGITGVVVLRAVIGTDGTVRTIEVVSGDPLLAPAAVDAVRQWVYRPTLLSIEPNAPVEVVTTVNVNFKLSGQ
jgi:periplasmic protein TonB